MRMIMTMTMMMMMMMTMTMTLIIIMMMMMMIVMNTVCLSRQASGASFAKALKSFEAELPLTVAAGFTRAAMHVSTFQRQNNPSVVHLRGHHEGHYWCFVASCDLLFSLALFLPPVIQSRHRWQYCLSHPGALH